MRESHDGAFIDGIERCPARGNAECQRDDKWFAEDRFGDGAVVALKERAVNALARERACCVQERRARWAVVCGDHGNILQHRENNFSQTVLQS